MAQFLADMYSKRVSLVCVGLEDVPTHYRRAIEKILGQLIHNAIRHGIEAPADRVVQDKPETGTVAVQFMRAGADGFQLSVQDDGRGLDHDRIRAEVINSRVALGSACVLVFFVWWESRVEHPLLDLNIFRIPAFTLGNSARWCNFYRGSRFCRRATSDFN